MEVSGNPGKYKWDNVHGAGNIKGGWSFISQRVVLLMFGGH